MRVVLLFAAVALLGMMPEARPAAETPYERGRDLYAMAEAGSEYCPDIAIMWGVGAVIARSYDYDFSADDQFDAAKQRLFDVFDGVGSRRDVCEGLMRNFGPGGSPHLFEWR